MKILGGQMTALFFGVVLSILGGACDVQARSISLEFKHPDLEEGKWIQYENHQLSYTRFCYIVSNVMLQDADGQWIACGETYGYISPFDGRSRMELEVGEIDLITGIRFTIGLSPEVNHGDPNQYSAEHPLNPNLNQMHWGWAGGYIFAALEGYYLVDGEKSGFSFHIANDEFSIPVEVEFKSALTVFDVIELEVGVSDVLSFSFSGDDAFSHSRPGDVIAERVKERLQAAFETAEVSGSQEQLVRRIQGHPEEGRWADLLEIDNKRFPQFALPADNPLTEEGVRLGEALFFDKRLSRDGSISCASCHAPENSFSDDVALSEGVEGALGNRNSMPLFNLAWKKEFFWDGRVEGLRNQVLHPIVDSKEMAADLVSLVRFLSADSDYSNEFERVFGAVEITPNLIGMAIEQYLLTLISTNSRFDEASRNEVEFTDQEKRGLELFITEYDPRRQLYGADCFHCHGNNLFTNHQYMNNGLDSEFSDLGRFLVTGEESDKGKFVTPSLRNVELTAPYMHDGRFKTLEEVVEHYSSGIQISDTLDPNLYKHVRGVQMSEADQAALVAFLKTLTDVEYRY